MVFEDALRYMRRGLTVKRSAWFQEVGFVIIEDKIHIAKSNELPFKIKNDLLSLDDIEADDWVMITVKYRAE